MAKSRVVFNTTGSDGLTNGQRNQLQADRSIRATREANEAASRLAQVGLQNKGNMDVTTANNAGQLQRENISQAGQTGREKMSNDASIKTTGMTNQGAMDRLVTGNTHAIDAATVANTRANETAKVANDFATAADHRKTSGAALLAGADPAQMNNALNPNPGMPVDYSGVKVPLKNNQVDNIQFMTQPAGLDGSPAAIYVGNKQTAQVSLVTPEAAALAGQAADNRGNIPGFPTGQVDPNRATRQPVAATPQRDPNAAGDAFAQVYRDNPQRLQEDAAFSVSQFETAHKTPEEQESYLMALRQSNPTLFQLVHPMLKQRYPATAK